MSWNMDNPNVSPKDHDPTKLVFPKEPPPNKEKQARMFGAVDMNGPVG